jgi:hypothetical protein
MQREDPQFIRSPSSFVHFLKNHLMMTYLCRNMLWTDTIINICLCDGNPFIFIWKENLRVDN